MTKKWYTGFILTLILSTLLVGADKEKKAYELIYRDIQLLKQQILQLDKKIEKNQEKIQSILKQFTEFLSLARLMQSEQADIKDEQKKLPTQYQVLLEKLEQINRQMEMFSEELIEIKQAATMPAAAPETQEESTEEGEGTGQSEGENEQSGDPTSSTEVTEDEGSDEQVQEELPPQIDPNLSPREVYNMAYSDYLKGNYPLAVEGFGIYLQQFPDSPLADNALYWIGECYFSQNQYDEAIDQFNELILNYPQGDKIPAAYLKKGISLIELEKKEEALSVFKLLISKYPLEEETKIAQEKIKELEGEDEGY